MHNLFYVEKFIHLRSFILFQQFSLHTDILKALTKIGYAKPTSIQQEAIPIALEGHDLIGCAQTGTGKTAAFALPILNKLHAVRRGRTRALILTPTRELAAQIKEVIQDLSTFTKLRVTAVYGGISSVPQERALKLGTDIVVAAPGRLLDHMQRGIGRFGGIEFLILDEADRMLDMGFLPDVRRIISYLPTERQTMLFSATMPDAIAKLSHEILKNPKTIQIGRQSSPAEGVSQTAYPVAQHLKTDLLITLLKKMSTQSVLIFTRTKVRTDRLARRLVKNGFHTGRIHSDCTQGQRAKALDAFRNGQVPILVATDIAARGIDIDGISHVINYDVPNTPEDYVHRIGRTARAKATGDALTLVAPLEEKLLVAIQQLTKTKMERLLVSGFDYNSAPVVSSRDKGRQQKVRSGSKSHKPRSQSTKSHQRFSKKTSSRKNPKSSNARRHSTQLSD